MGLSYEIEEYPEDLEDFAKIYYQTMDRNQADSRYYFDLEYFKAFVETMPESILKCKVMLDNNVIAMGFYLRSHDVLHTHLSGTLTDYIHLSPAYILRYALVEWGKANGYKLIHSGGGMTGSTDDSLYRFKKKFGINTEFLFFIGRKIWNESVYRELVSATKTQKSTFFPQYRT